jgi:hypothetical protein
LKVKITFVKNIKIFNHFKYTATMNKLHLATSHKPQATSHKPQATSHKPQATRWLILLIFSMQFSIFLQAQENCQPPVFFEGEPESGFCSGQLPTCTIVLGTTITQSSQIPSGILSGTICIEGDFTITSGNAFTFLFATILISPEVEIRVDPSASLLISSSDLHGCNGLWKGIRLLNNTELHLTNNTIIEDARKAVNASYVSTEVYVDNTTFNRNLTGIWLEDSPNSTNPPHISTLFNSNFTCDAPIVGTIKDISEYGIYSLNCPVSYQHSSEEDDHDVLFRNLKYGIKIEGERSIDLIGNNFFFREIRYAGIDLNKGKIELEESIFSNYGDYGILTRKLRGLLLSGCDFQLIETDPKFFPAPSPGIRSAVAINTDWQFATGEYPKIDIINKCSFTYDCPAVDENYWGIVAGGIGNRMEMLVYDNDIFVEGQNAQGIHITGGYLKGSEIDILANRFTVNGPTPLEPGGGSQCFGIAAISEVNHLDIVGNDFYGQREEDLDEIRSHFIDLYQNNGSENNQITDNTFFGDVLVGVFLFKSSNWKICSNSSVAVDNAYYFQNENMGVDFTHNEISFGIVNINGKIFLQEQKDNTFWGINGAICWSGDCFFFSRFLVRQALGSEFYPNVQLCGNPPSPCTNTDEFFRNLPGDAPDACAAEFNQPGDEQFLISIASGTIEQPNEYPSKIWDYKNFLFAKLKSNPGLISSHPSFLTFVENEEVSSLGKFFDVKKLTSEGLMGSATGFDLAKLQSALTLNSSISTQNVIENNQKQLNHIILTAFLFQNGEFTEQQLHELREISSQCYREGGPAVVQAATLLTGCDFYNIEPGHNCGDELPILQEVVESAERQDTNLSGNSLTVVQNIAYLSILVPQQQTGRLSLYNSAGTEVFSKAIVGTEGAIQIPTENLSSGIYFVAFTGNRNLIAKVAISR